MREFLSSVVFACVTAILLPASAVPSSLHAQPHYDLLWNDAISSEAGAENLATLHRSFTALENRVLPLRWTEEGTVGQKALGIAYRAGRVVLLDGTITYMAALTQHEVFGHGAALRQLDIYGSRYELRLPPPYGIGGGLADYPDDAQFGPFEDIHVTANGMNGTLQLARTVRDRAVLRGRLYYDEALLSLAGHLDLPTYVWGTSSPPECFNDVVSYLNELDRLPNSPTLSSLKLNALVSLLDPFALLSLRSAVVDYLRNGTPSASLPTLEWRSVRYLPSVHLALSPFGPEVLVEHLAAHDGQLWRLTTRLGSGPYGQFGGAGIEVSNVMQTNRMHTDISLNLWYQPTRLLNETVQRARRRLGPTLDPFAIGGRLEVSASLRPTPEWPVYATGTLGYKTNGFLLGEGLHDGLLMEVGLRLDSSILE